MDEKFLTNVCADLCLVHQTLMSVRYTEQQCVVPLDVGPSLRRQSVLPTSIASTHWARTFVSLQPTVSEDSASTPTLAAVWVSTTALLECVSENAVQAYTTPDSAVSYLNYAQMA